MLFTPRLFVLDEAGHSEKLNIAGFPLQSVCVVPRGECSFRRVRLVGNGRNARRAAELKIRNDALPGETDFFIFPDKNSLDAPGQMAGAWSFARNANHQGRYIPEVLAQVPLDNGHRLVKALSGFDGQVWEEGNLIASRWWPDTPSKASWKAFLRAAQDRGYTSEAPSELPTAVTVPWRSDLPIFAMDAERLQTLFSPLNLGVAATLIFACGFSYIGAKYIREHASYKSAQAQADSLSSEVELILSQRRRALGAMRYVHGYDGLGHKGTVLAGFDSVATVLGSTELGIERAIYRNNKLELRLKGDADVSISDVVSLLEAQPATEDVTVSLEALGAVAVTAKLLPPRRKPDDAELN